MSAIPQTVTPSVRTADQDSAVHATFLKLLPAVQNHAAIQFRHLTPGEREEAIAEATAAAFVNFKAAVRLGTTHRVKASMLAHYAALHVRHGKHVGGSRQSRRDVLSPHARRRGGFQVLPLAPGIGDFDCMTDPTAPVWNQRLRHDRRTPVADQAAFRMDLSQFLSQQTGRTRTLLSLLAEGHRQTEVADRMGLTPAALCMRRKKAAREWQRLQGPER